MMILFSRRTQEIFIYQKLAEGLEGKQREKLKKNQNMARVYSLGRTAHSTTFRF